MRFELDAYILYPYWAWKSENGDLHFLSHVFHYSSLSQAIVQFTRVKN